MRSVVHFLSARNLSAADIHWQICEVYGATALCEGKVRKWVGDFNIGHDNIHDDSLSSRPSVITDYMELKILENRCFTISTLSNDFPEVSRSVLYKIVSEKLNFKKLCSRWVPKLLTQDHKNKRFECSLNFLTHYNEEGDAMLSQIVTGDETWVSHVMPESKQQSMEWRHTYSPVRVKAKQTLSQCKIMASVFWDRHDVLLVDFMQRGTTINAVAYGQTMRKLRRAIQNKRHGMLTEGILLLHDNARPHTAAQIRALFDSWLGNFAAPTLRQAIFIFSTISNIISVATTTTITKT
ncbi:Histone-lysine N-methyltransferase SETMAR [Araneus ventricosus]|uniref:Histone-lysine N-methyltransferase SETMAR n=1 Tax=Araneus ventricosus TaxID=182803 RepID=A0A4Y2LXL7_ARAVE|nr:Histone-lysine N-methyltransferase SETMAR [Araneus ventricosus]